MGAIAADADQGMLAAITDFGRHLGLAFQIVDDILDVTSTPEKMGKTTNKDASKGKNTYPVLLGMGASQKQAASELDAAMASLSLLGARADSLRKLARFVVERQT